MTQQQVNSLSILGDILENVPDGTTADVLSGDLEAGNFDTAHLVMPSGTAIDIAYSGPVADGYVSPFEGSDI